MNILYLVSYTPTIIRTRPHNFIRALARRGHQLTIATLWENLSEFEFMQDLSAETGIKVLAFPISKTRRLYNLISAIFTPYPLQSRYSWHPSLARAVKTAIHADHFDVIQIEHLRGSPYGLYLNKSITQAQPAPALIYDSVDCISLIYEHAMDKSQSPRWRWITRFELPRTRRYEAHMVHNVDRVLVTSKKDKNALQKLAAQYPSPGSKDGFSKQLPEDHIVVVPNGVDLDEFGQPSRHLPTKTIVFSGKMSYHPNLSAAIYLVRDIMPRIWANDPEVRVQLVGKDPPEHIRKLALEDSRVQVTGWVPSLQPYLSNADVAVAPMTYGSGIQNKVLEAMACGTPVVVTPIAISAISVTPGRDLLVGDTSTDLSKEILRLLTDPSLRVQIGQNGRKFVEKYHHWDHFASQLEQIYQLTKTPSRN